MPVVNEDNLHNAFRSAKAEFGVFEDQLAKFLRIGSGDTSAIHLAGAAAIEHIEKLLGIVPAGDDTDITEENPTITDAHPAPVKPVVQHTNIRDGHVHTPVPETPKSSATIQSAVDPKKS